MIMKTVAPNNNEAEAIRNMETYIMRVSVFYGEFNEKHKYVTIRCIAKSIEAAIAWVRMYGLPQEATIISCKIDPVGTMIAK